MSGHKQTDCKPTGKGPPKKVKPPAGANTTTSHNTETGNDGDDESSKEDEAQAADLPVTTNHFGRMYVYSRELLPEQS